MRCWEYKDPQESIIVSNILPLSTSVSIWSDWAELTRNFHVIFQYLYYKPNFRESFPVGEPTHLPLTVTIRDTYFMQRGSPPIWKMR
jgi:hypothetical protein